jgi:hypothetical protein
MSMSSLGIICAIEKQSMPIWRSVATKQNDCVS